MTSFLGHDWTELLINRTESDIVIIKTHELFVLNVQTLKPTLI